MGPTSSMRKRSSQRYLATFVAGLLLGYGGCALASNAEIVFVQGKAEEKGGEKQDWQAAKLSQEVPAGGYVRTLANSQLGLLLADRTQIRLNQNSVMQVKSVSDSAEWKKTTVKLSSGRAWSQARPAKGPSAGQETTRLSMETPSATMSVRGTDWEVEILPDGSTQLVVLSGVVDIGNEVGSLRVEPGEKALAEPGKQPVKTRLVNPKSRIQWVSAWQVQPERWGGAGSDAPIRQAADAMVHRGKIDEAIGLLAARAADPKAEPLTVALFTRILAIDDRLAEARQRIEQALQQVPQDRELLLARGDLAILDGDVEAARSAFSAILAASAHEGDAWYGLGRIESERGNIDVAREFLDKALGTAAVAADARSERAIVETRAGNHAAAAEMLGQLLAENPENYIAQTALGLNLLQRGQTDLALHAFLKAGTIEPGYARAWLYSAAAFYRLDDRNRALQALERATQLDPHDPLPHFLRSLVLSDELKYGDAIVAAREARERLPYLKSLDQIANDRKGSANLGSALANFGLEEWASHQARGAATPFWASSHLFLSDRHIGSFNKNSELYMGFLTDPTVFGASNRNSSLLSVPGHYATTDLVFERAEWRQTALVGTLNGMIVAPFPFAYFLSGDLSAANSRLDGSSGDGRQFTLGLGAKPRHDFGLFAFTTSGRTKADLSSETLTDDRFRLDDDRSDIGLNFKLSPERQLWLKMGEGKQRSRVAGTYVSSSFANALNRLLATTVFQPSGQLNDFGADFKREDIQLRYASAIQNGQLSIGIEAAHAHSPGSLDLGFAPARLIAEEAANSRTRDAYLAARINVTPGLSLQGELWRQRGDIRRHETINLTVPAAGINLPIADTVSHDHYGETNPRLGISWAASKAWTARLAAQRWRRPASVGTLSDVDTAGIPLNDRLVSIGGLYKRGRIQFDGEVSERAFLQFFLDRERIDNGVNGQAMLAPTIDLTQLESLKNRRVVFEPSSDLEATPEYERGKVSSFGIAGNYLLSRRQTLAFRYIYRDGDREGSASGLDIPYIPQHMLRLGSHWSLPDNLLVGLHATYRTQRYEDRDNLERLDAGWNLGGTLYWETPDRLDGVQLIVDDVNGGGNVSAKKRTTFLFRYTHKF